MRWARANAWFSAAGFHQGSKSIMLSAAVRFKPDQPARNPIKKIRTASSF